MTRHLSAREARSRFAELTDRVRYTGEPVVVEKQGQPFVAVVSLDDLEAIEHLRNGDSTEAVQPRIRSAYRVDSPRLISPPGADPHHFELEMTIEPEDIRFQNARLRGR